LAPRSAQTLRAEVCAESLRSGDGFRRRPIVAAVFVMASTSAVPLRERPVERSASLHVTWAPPVAHIPNRRHPALAVRSARTHPK